MIVESHPSSWFSHLPVGMKLLCTGQSARYDDYIVGGVYTVYQYNPSRRCIYLIHSETGERYYRTGISATWEILAPKEVVFEDWL